MFEWVKNMFEWDKKIKKNIKWLFIMILIIFVTFQIYHNFQSIFLNINAGFWKSTIFFAFSKVLKSNS